MLFNSNISVAVTELELYMSLLILHETNGYIKPQFLLPVRMEIWIPPTSEAFVVSNGNHGQMEVNLVVAFVVQRWYSL